MGAVTAVVNRGCVTLPEEVRERLGVCDGDQLEFFFVGERTFVKRVYKAVNPFTQWIGTAKNVPEGYDSIAAQREMRGWDEWDYEQYG